MSLCRAERPARRQQGREQEWDLPEWAGPKWRWNICLRTIAKLVLIQHRQNQPPAHSLYGRRDLLLVLLLRSLPTSLSWEGRGMDGGGCHGNWESVVTRHHLLLLGAEQAHEYLSFMDIDRRTTRALPCSCTRQGDEGRMEGWSQGSQSRWQISAFGL